jgi:hypothetical protein
MKAHLFIGDHKTYAAYTWTFYLKSERAWLESARSGGYTTALSAKRAAMKTARKLGLEVVELEER